MKNCEEPWICAREDSNGKPKYAGKRARRSWEIGEKGLCSCNGWCGGITPSLRGLL